MSSTSSNPVNSSSQIRRRPLHQHVLRALAAVFVASSSPSRTSCMAFYPPVLAVTSKALNGNGSMGNIVHEGNNQQQHAKQQTLIMPKYKQSWSAIDQAASSSEKELRQREASRWLSWLKFGNRRQVGDIRMREAEELGGIPRSDRYSSR